MAGIEIRFSDRSGEATNKATVHVCRATTDSQPALRGLREVGGQALAMTALKSVFSYYKGRILTLDKAAMLCLQNRTRSGRHERWSWVVDA